MRGLIALPLAGLMAVGADTVRSPASFQQAAGEYWSGPGMSRRLPL